MLVVESQQQSAWQATCDTILLAAWFAKVQRTNLGEHTNIHSNNTTPRARRADTNVGGLTKNSVCTQQIMGMGGGGHGDGLEGPGVFEVQPARAMLPLHFVVVVHAGQHTWAAIQLPLQVCIGWRILVSKGRRDRGGPGRGPQTLRHHPLGKHKQIGPSDPGPRLGRAPMPGGP